ncbi:Insulin-like growth factor binding protein, N-terminal [Pseudocohnilembus persalinus]|uniref:Insulin-like growth factor binding protein, N-terminal n=1 Tax=Pseudocohnilembus persalinus TaxID=266149 RepID=A0A0V0QLL9_PSEPJ|nr:Insulin-like growth factor binding protein, N-terminal [Pseudocohnilembus persalinus]|eukprot:KRX02853.1 Insulin-like growth factor binding protein, N-terminal [Pseudocohnilembus persalinus]
MLKINYAIDGEKTPYWYDGEINFNAKKGEEQQQLEDLIFNDFNIIIISLKNIIMQNGVNIIGSKIGIYANQITINSNNSIQSKFGCLQGQGIGKGSIFNYFDLQNQNQICSASGGSHRGYGGIGRLINLVELQGQKLKLNQQYQQQQVKHFDNMNFSYKRNLRTNLHGKNSTTLQKCQNSKILQDKKINYHQIKNNYHIKEYDLHANNINQQKKQNIQNCPLLNSQLKYLQNIQTYGQGAVSESGSGGGSLSGYRNDKYGQGGGIIILQSAEILTLNGVLNASGNPGIYQISNSNNSYNENENKNIDNINNNLKNEAKQNSTNQKNDTKNDNKQNIINQKNSINNVDKQKYNIKNDDIQKINTNQKNDSNQNLIIGGGSGGSVFIMAKNLLGQGKILAQGGASDSQGIVGEGGGGFINIILDSLFLTSDAETFTGEINYKAGQRDLKINSQNQEEQNLEEYYAEIGTFESVQCPPGYQKQQKELQCELCPSMTFKSSYLGSCQQCPENLQLSYSNQKGGMKISDCYQKKSECMHMECHLFIIFDKLYGLAGIILLNLLLIFLILGYLIRRYWRIKLHFQVEQIPLYYDQIDKDVKLAKNQSQEQEKLKQKPLQLNDLFYHRHRILFMGTNYHNSPLSLHINPPEEIMPITRIDEYKKFAKEIKEKELKMHQEEEIQQQKNKNQQDSTLKFAEEMSQIRQKNEKIKKSLQDYIAELKDIKYYEEQTYDIKISLVVTKIQQTVKQVLHQCESSDLSQEVEQIKREEEEENLNIYFNRQMLINRSIMEDMGLLKE